MKYFRFIFDIGNKLGYILTRRQKKIGILVMIMICIGSFLDMLGVTVILPFIETIMTPEEVMSKWYVKFVVKFFHLSDMAAIITVIGVGIIFIYMIKNLYLYFSLMVQTIYRSKIQKNLSTKMLRAYMQRPYEYFININSAEVLRGIGVDIIGVYNLLDSLFRFISEFLTAILIGIFLIMTDPFMALSIILIAGLCFTVITVGLKKKTGYYGEQVRITDTIRSNCALQAIMGFKEIKVTQTTDYFVEAYDMAYEEQRKAQVNNEYISNLPEKVIEAMCVAVLMGVICVKINIGEDMTNFLPKLAAFAVAAFRLLPSVSRMARYMNGVIFNNAFLQSAYKNLIEIEQYNLVNVNGNITIEEKLPINFTEKVVVQNITWNYQGGEKNILSEMNITINKGDSVGLIGASGAGKTTLADVILGLLKPQKGTVLMDGLDIFEHPKGWSQIIGYVPQNIFLSDDTIRNNVAFGHRAESIDDEMIWKALREAQLEEYVRNLPMQLDTRVGERGIRFSGGQRQRVAIARALYSNPEIIVLDEATSALDNETESAVMEAIDALQGYKTLIIVAHRLTTIRRCNKIYEIIDGKAIEKNWNEVSKIDI